MRMGDKKKKLKCPKCKTIIKIKLSKDPIEFKCPKCGKEGKFPGKKKERPREGEEPFNKKMLCPRCNKVIPIESPERPLKIRCANCGLIGMIQPDRKPFKWPWQKKR